MPPFIAANNRLLAALPPRDYRRLERHLEPVALDFGNGNSIHRTKVLFPATR